MGRLIWFQDDMYSRQLPLSASISDSLFLACKKERKLRWDQFLADKDVRWNLISTDSVSISLPPFYIPVKKNYLPSSPTGATTSTHRG